MGCPGDRAAGAAARRASVGGRTRWKRARAVLISPAMPAAGMAWPIMEETAPRKRWPCARCGEDGTQRAELGAIGGGNAQAVAFDQGTVAGSIPGRR